MVLLVSKGSDNVDNNFEQNSFFQELVNGRIYIDIFGLLLIFLVPIIMYYISCSNADESNVLCSKKDSNVSLISYNINISYNGFNLKEIEYVLNYDVSSLSSINKKSLREEEVELGRKYQEEANVTYFVLEENGMMSLHVYGDSKDIVKFFDAKYASNKTFLVNKLKEDGFSCEEK